MKTKWNLSKAEQLAHDANVRRLIAAGIAIERDKKLPSKADTLRIEQLGAPSDNIILSPAGGGYVIAVWVRIIALLSGTCICDWQITPRGWNDSEIHLVEVPYGSGYCRNIAQLEYAEDDVLNDRMFGRALRYGEALEGVLVAQSFTLLPVRFSNGMQMGAELTLIDQFDNPNAFDLQLRLVRDTKSARHIGQHGSLCDEPRTGESNPGLVRAESDQGTVRRIALDAPAPPQIRNRRAKPLGGWTPAD